MTDLDRLFEEAEARWDALRAQGKPLYWKPRGSHRRNKGKRRGSRDPWCHHYSRHDVQYIDVECAWGWCLHKVCPTCNKITWGFGPVACPCDHTNGWKSKYADGQAKPHPPVKAIGRFAGRVQAARRKNKEREAVTARWS